MITHELRLTNHQGWRTGLAQLLRAENGRWWRTRRWWVQALIWLALLNGILATAVWANDGGGQDSAIRLFFDVAHAFVTIGAVVLMQSAIVGEKQAGTAAWLLSKPVSRAAFVLAKGLSTWLAALILIILLQGGLAYGQLALKWGEVGLRPFAAALLMAGLHLSFYLMLTLMLGTFFRSRGPVVGIPIALFFIPIALASVLQQVTPWWFALTPTAFVLLAGDVATGAMSVPFVPLLATAVWTILFVATAVWRFGREQF